MSTHSLQTVTNYLDSRLGIKIYGDPYQQKYVKSLLESTKDTQAIFVDAAAGTGKTSLAVSVAYYLLTKGDIDQIVYVKNTSMIRELGFLPGDIAEKEGPYMQPGLDALSRIEKNNPKLIETLISNDQLVVTSTAFLRGVDWNERKFIIVDEAQNMNLQELQMVLTRPHDDSKVVIIGSTLQCDEGRKAEKYGEEGLLPFSLFAYHFSKTGLNIKILTLKNNYRGKFSLLADKINQTIQHLEVEKSLRGDLTLIVDEEEDIQEVTQLWEELGVSAFK